MSEKLRHRVDEFTVPNEEVNHSHLLAAETAFWLDGFAENNVYVTVRTAKLCYMAHQCGRICT